ncbi:hypothetical protein [Oceanobacillus alkalisoli]|uniref:hypothetical protein n=1 Tax=Oceanobacillus alkalisoli TaxID=2925113 RepID=UPI001F119717|nr:hypothetical protein [Oceanobacillus alkalisoli]MCF3944525.1 hypothetical protein [Oceanobacillus alkalisoli]
MLRLYLEVEIYNLAKRLLRQYKNDASTNFAFNEVLLHYFRDGFTAKTILKHAVNENPYAIFLTGEKTIRSYDTNIVANVQDGSE